MAGRKLRSDFNLGGEAAEADPLLEAAFYDSGLYSSIKNPTNPHCFLIGRTGSGKTALLRHLKDERPDHVIRINPEDLSLPYLLDLQVVQTLTAKGVRLDPFYVALWKHVFLVEIIQHRYHIDSPVAKRSFIDGLRARIGRDASKRAALDYLDAYGESFWCETDERVREISEHFARGFDLSSGLQGELPGVASAVVKASYTASKGGEIKSEETEIYQRIVNEAQLARLNKMIETLDEEILDASQNFTYLVIDDLDRDWVDDQVSNDLIRCLFRTALDMQSVRHLKIVIALRTNIFENLDFGSRTGGQEEKFRSLKQDVKWTKGELEHMADERARVAAERGEITHISSVKSLLPAHGRQGVHPLDHLLSRTLMRPRDLIAFLNEALSLVSGKSRLSWKDIDNAEHRYSEDRLLALRDEWKQNYPGLDRVFEQFRACPARMDRAALIQRLDECALLPADPTFKGVVWMTELSLPLWSNAGTDFEGSYFPMIELLFRVGLIGVSKKNGHIYFSHVDAQPALSNIKLGDATHFSVHPMYHMALDIA